MHEGFWSWREAYPAEPYWVHFQTTDVHANFPAALPFAGLFVGPEEQETWRDWYDRLDGGGSVYNDAFENTGISRRAFFTLNQGLYDETMAHNDYQLGRDARKSARRSCEAIYLHHRRQQAGGNAGWFSIADRSFANGPGIRLQASPGDTLQPGMARRLCHR